MTVKMDFIVVELLNGIFLHRDCVISGANEGSKIMGVVCIFPIAISW